MATIEEDEVPPDAADADAPALAQAQVAAPKGPSGMPMFDPRALDQQSQDATAQRNNLALAGAIAQNLGNRHSFGEFFTGKMNPNQDYQGYYNQLAQNIPDPYQRAKSILGAYQQNAQMQIASQELDPQSPRSKMARETMKSILPPKLASSIGDNLSAAQLKETFPMYEKAMSNQSSQDVASMNNASAQKIEGMKEGAEKNRMMAEMKLKYPNGIQAPPELQKEISSLVNAKKQLADLADAATQNSSHFGPTTGTVGSMNPYDQFGQGMETKLTNTAEAVNAGMNGGNSSPRMFQNIRNSLGSQANDADAFKTRIQTTQHVIDQKLADAVKRARGGGFNLSGFDIPSSMTPQPAVFSGPKQPNVGGAANAAPAPRPTTVIQNGHTYTLNADTGKYE